MKARGPGQSAHLLIDVVAMLADHKIEYAVIGAMAAAVYGAIRATTDSDALLSVSEAKLAQLEKVFKKAGFATDLRRGDLDDPIPALLAVSDRHANRVDLLAGLRGLDPLALSRSITVPFLGSSLRVIGREDFIAMKCFAGGPQDVTDAAQALAAVDQPLDLQLLRRTTRRFGRAAADVLEKLLRV
jgi:predicted nucleotidyltransferase